MKKVSLDLHVSEWSNSIENMDHDSGREALGEYSLESMNKVAPCGDTRPARYLPHGRSAMNDIR